MENFRNKAKIAFFGDDLELMKTTMFSIFKNFYTDILKVDDDGEIDASILPDIKKIEKEIKILLVAFRSAWPKHCLLKRCKMSYEDICCGFCSLLLDLYAFQKSNDFKADASSSLSILKIMLGHSSSHVYDAVIQSSTLTTKYIEHWDIICEKLLSNCKQTEICSNHEFFKRLMSLIKWRLAVPENEKIKIENIALNARMPPNFIAWCKSYLVDILPDVSSCTSNADLVKFLLKRVENTSILEDVVSVMGVESSDDVEQNELQKTKQYKEKQNDQLFFIDKVVSDNEDVNLDVLMNNLPITSTESKEDQEMSKIDDVLDGHKMEDMDTKESSPIKSRVFSPKTSSDFGKKRKRSGTKLNYSREEVNDELLTPKKKLETKSKLKTPLNKLNSPKPSKIQSPREHASATPNYRRSLRIQTPKK